MASFPTSGKLTCSQGRHKAPVEEFIKDGKVLRTCRSCRERSEKLRKRWRAKHEVTGIRHSTRGAMH